jgi:eukaryotic-like serine/threonine-protein kinase
MSHRFVRCPHCRMPHDAAERVCPNTGLRLGEPRPPPREPRLVPRSAMSEVPPPSRPPEPLSFVAQRDRAAKPKEERPPTTGSQELAAQLIGKTVGGRYLIRGVLGKGGMGTVYDAEHLGLGRQVAIKVLSPSQAKKRVAVKRFQQEARAAGAIGHPNICEVYDLGLLDDASPYLVMEKLVGQTLADRIGKEGGLPIEDVIEVVVQVLSGLIAAHEKGIVHRDIKPENIFLARRPGSAPIIKLLDFGVSKMMPEFQTGEESLDLTRTGMVMGTPYYMAPEQARGERNLDGRVDVYACGVVMYEALVGRRPFLAPNYNALLLSIINTTPKPIRESRPSVPAELEAMVMRAMTKNRDERYPSALAFLRELSPASAEARVASPPRAGAGKAPAALRVRPEDARRAEPTGPTDQFVPSEATPVRKDGVATEAAPGTEEVDIPVVVEDEDLPTEVFRPGHHPVPALARSQPRAAYPAPPPPPPQPPIAPAVPPMGHPSLSEDWEGETMVKRPEALPPSSPPEPLDNSPPTLTRTGHTSRDDLPPRPAAGRPFNPDDTMKIDDAVGLELLDAHRQGEER